MEEKIEQAGWNLAQHIIIELSKSLNGATENYISGHYSKAFSFLRGVRMRISPSLTPDEKDSLIKKEKELFKYTNSAKTDSFNSTSEQKIAFAKVFLLYGEYNDLIMDNLKRYGFLIPPKEDKTKLN